MNARNPYLQDMADEIGRRSNLGLQQGFQGIRSNSAMVGGLGGSRQGVAEGAAIAGAADTLQGNLANMYNTDYQAEEGRGVQRYGIDSVAASSRYAADKSFEASKYSADNSLSGVRFSSENSLAGTKYGSDNALKGSMYGADSSLAGSMYGSDNALQGSMYSADTSRDIATMNDGTNRRGQDQTFATNTDRNGIDSRNATTNATRVNNDYLLGLKGDVVATTNAATNRAGVDNNFKLGSDRLIQDGGIHRDNLGISKDRLALDTTTSNRNYDVNLRQADLQSDRLDLDTYNSNFGNQVTGIRVGMDAQDRLQNNNATAVKAGTDMQNTPLNYYKTFNGAASDLGNAGGGTTGSTSSQGDPLVSALGGAQIGSKIVSNLGFGNKPPVYDGGYTDGTGTAYGGTTENGVYTPYRRGM